MRLSSRGRMAAVVSAALLVASACGGGGDSEESTPSTSTTVATTVPVSLPPTTTTTIPYDGPIGPLTGAPIEPDRVDMPVLVMKIGNNDSRSRPQTGLSEADVVYEELVEGLKTRLFAVFNSRMPESIGPIRSGRSSDLDLFAGLAKPMFGYSGGNATVLGELHNARVAGKFVDVGQFRLESAYFRSEDRDAPYNLYLTPSLIPETSSRVPDPLFVYGDPDPSVGEVVGGVEVTYPSSVGRRSTHVWDAQVEGWVRIQDETLHTSVVDDVEIELAPANVVVARVFYTTSKADADSPQATTFGTGEVQVFTRGRMITGTWSRSASDPDWKFLDEDGREIALAPGATWVLLAANKHSAFASAKVTVISESDAAELLADARNSATS